MWSLKYWNIPIPTAWTNYIWQNWVENNVYACLLIHLDFSDKLWWPVVVYVYTTIWRAGDKLLTIQAKIAFNGEPRDTMAFIPFILVQPERWTWREDSNIICIGLGNETWLEWMAPNTWTCIGFHINLRQGKTSITLYVKQAKMQRCYCLARYNEDHCSNLTRPIQQMLNISCSWTWWENQCWLACDVSLH